jgi:hypothetical protein
VLLYERLKKLSGMPNFVATASACNLASVGLKEGKSITIEIGSSNHAMIHAPISSDELLSRFYGHHVVQEDDYIKFIRAVREYA